MATLANLRTRITSKLGLDNTASSAEQSLVDSWANEGVIRVLLDTHCRVNIATMALIADKKDYDLPSGILAFHRIVDADSKQVERVSAEDIFDARRANSTSTDAVTLRYALDGANLLMVWPTPDSADSLTVYYVPNPTAMSDGTHDPANATYGGVPTEYHKAIEYYALAQAADYDDDQTSDQGQRYLGLYLAELAYIRRAGTRKGSRKLSPVKPGSALARRRRVPSDPSALLP